MVSIFLSISQKEFNSIFITITTIVFILTSSTNDTTSFQRSNFGQALQNDEIDIPVTRILPNTNIECECFFIGDEGFPLKKYIMIPFQEVQGRRMLASKKIFNIRLSNARKNVERAFGIICRRWKVFETPLDFNISTSEIIIMCAVSLHNYLITMSLENQIVDSESSDDDSDTSNEASDSTSNNTTYSECLSNEASHVCTSSSCATDESSSTDEENVCSSIDDSEEEEDLENEINDGKRIRNLLANYFTSPEGSTRWQWEKY